MPLTSTHLHQPITLCVDRTTVLCARWGLGLLRKWAADDSVIKALESPTPCEEEVRDSYEYPGSRQIHEGYRQRRGSRCSNSIKKINNSNNDENNGLENTKGYSKKYPTRANRTGDRERCIHIHGGRCGSRTGIGGGYCRGTDRPKTSGGLVLPCKTWRIAATAPGSNKHDGVVTTATAGDESEREACLRLVAPAGERELSLAWTPSAVVGDEISVEIFTPGVRGGGWGRHI